MARNVTLRGIAEGIGIAGILAYVLGLPAAPVAPPIARLDDDASPVPRPDIAAVFHDAADPTGGLAGLGAGPDGIPVSDAPAAPLKLRRIQVVRADAPTETAALRAYTQNTGHRAKRANRDIPGIVAGVSGRYGPVIREAAALHNVPASIIATKICIENPDLLARAVTGGGATGIMQIAPGTADDLLRGEYRAGNLLPAEAAYFQAHLGAARWAALLAGRPVNRTADLQNAAYCIHVGTLAFGQLLRKYTDVATGEVQLYKAAAEYNRGARAGYANARVGSPDQLIAYRNGVYSTPAITQQYIMLYCGPGGPLDYITRNGLLA